MLVNPCTVKTSYNILHPFIKKLLYEKIFKMDQYCYWLINSCTGTGSMANAI